MKLNEKVLYIIIIVLLAVIGILFYRGCVSDNGDSATVVRGQIQSIAGTIQYGLDIIQHLKGVYSELARERDHYRDLAEQLRTRVADLEQRYSSFEEYYIRFRKYQRENIESNRRIADGCDDLGSKIDSMFGPIEKLGGIFRGIRSGTEIRTD